MNKLKGFLTLTPPGSISTISYKRYLKKKINHTADRRYHNKLITNICAEHEPDMPSLPVVLKTFSPDGSARGTRRVRVCILCWEVCGPIRSDDSPKGELMRTAGGSGVRSTRIQIAGSIKYLEPYDGTSKYPTQITRVEVCKTHPSLRVPVSLISSERMLNNIPIKWTWTEDAKCCPFCWFIYSRVPVEPVILKGDDAK